MRLSLLPLLGALASTVLADVKFTTPAAGAALPAGSLSITWADSGDSPALSELTSYQLFLCAGGNEDGSYVSYLWYTREGTLRTHIHKEGLFSKTRTDQVSRTDSIVDFGCQRSVRKWKQSHSDRRLRPRREYNERIVCISVSTLLDSRSLYAKPRP